MWFDPLRGRICPAPVSITTTGDQGLCSLSCSGTYYAIEQSFSPDALDGLPIGRPCSHHHSSHVAGQLSLRDQEATYEGIKAYRLCTGPDNLSHVIEGSIDQKAMTDVNALHFKETPAHSQYDWHAAPEEQYVITLSGTLEFSTTGGENFVLRPGEILLAQDTTGPGHRWKLIDDQPWRRAYVITKPGDKAAFVPKDGAASKGC
ncbi:Uncharacterized protein ALO49_00766 [Pseudomonas savastanoi pv. retacarpa]|nr:Uncharacterized protein ALO49_00766 [Pseudomonas savastanoi pv. retacarpa]RML30951.1 hypothetical protein ALR00_03124 [Pseudomonas savastanoi pv. retacarpa]RMP43198.1 hypothetical protein ALQ22_03227 [Pseudomonas savastanoi pv. retacarpa]